ncbi:hypothetical protein O0L34_g4821 [Tuta absoluta]|nr:hypothetical protein O0L34_g4821 [Tuta absoluta]
MFIKAGPGPAEEERRGSVSNWFSSLRRGGRRKREEAVVPSSYGSLGRRKDGSQPRGKTRSAWDLTTVSRLVCISFIMPQTQRWCLFCWRLQLARIQIRWIDDALSVYVQNDDCTSFR